MSNKIDTLLNAYESGALTRRQFLAAVSALLPVVSHGQTKTPAPFVARGINHITLSVKDLARSREFYERLFQFPRAKQVDKDEYSFGMGNTFLFLGASHESSIDHFCIGIDGYDPQTRRFAHDDFRNAIDEWGHVSQPLLGEDLPRERRP